MNLNNFTIILLGLCKKHGASTTSWIRSPKHNADVGGKPTSHHLDGTAADVIFDDPAQLAPFRAGCHAVGLIAVDEGDHVHVQTPRLTATADLGPADRPG